MLTKYCYIIPNIVTIYNIFTKNIKIKYYIILYNIIKGNDNEGVYFIFVTFVRVCHRTDSE